jgi:Ca-activated chloride channel family protein
LKLLVHSFLKLLLLSTLCFGQQSTQEQSNSEPTFKVDVRLVNVFVTVTDEHGAPIGGLTKDQFELFEDNVPQKIAIFSKESQLPLSIILAVDTSSSTRRDIRLELDAAKRFAHSILRKQDVLSLYQFSTEVNEVVPFTNDLARIDRGIHDVTVGGATVMYDAIYLAADTLINRQGRKVLVLITDGGDTTSSTSYQEALRAAQQSEALVYSIIVVPVESSAGRNTGGEHALIQLSNDTGGKYYYAANIPEVEKAFAEISEELRTQYLLAYYPARRLSRSDFRTIDVRVHPVLAQAADSAGSGDAEKGAQQKFIVRHRKGYYTSKLH